MNRKKIFAGFTIIELLIVITIVGVLAAIAVPAYRSYMLRSKLVDAIAVANSWKIKVSTVYNDTEKLPQTCGDTSGGVLTDINNPTNTVARIRWCNTSSAIETLLNNTNLGPEFINKEIWLKVSIIGDFLKWECGTSNDPNKQIACKYLPASCQLNCAN